MYGWRGRIGLIIPSSDATSEAEYSKYSPDGVEVLASRMHLQDGVVDAQNLQRMSADTERCARLLATAGVDVIAYSCTTGSLIKGKGFEEELEDRITAQTGVPAVATAASIIRAFCAFGVTSIAIHTPYKSELNDIEVEYIEDHGFNVVDIDGLGLISDREIGKQQPEQVYREVMTLNYSRADCIFISCTGYRTFDVIEKIESDTGKPVVTSNQATLWDAMRTMEINCTELNLGELFQTC